MIKKYTQEEFDNACLKDTLPIQCDFCGKIFNRTKKVLQNSLREPSKMTFCSVSCSSTFQRKKPRLVKCAYCDKEFERNRSERKFCSTTCFNSFQKDNDNYKKFIKCKECGKEIKVRKNCKSKKCNECASKPKLKDIQKCSCQCCGKEMYVTSRIAKVKKFCSGTCRNKINNPKLNGHRSKAELLLEEKIKNTFPNLTILANDRMVLDGLELDMYIPQIKTAIEWNGVHHILPIHGEQKLEYIKAKDNKKKALCLDKGINLIVIEDAHSHKKFIQSKTDEIISCISNLYPKT